MLVTCQAGKRLFSSSVDEVIKRYEKGAGGRGTPENGHVSGEFAVPGSITHHRHFSSAEKWARRSAGDARRSLLWSLCPHLWTVGGAVKVAARIEGLNVKLGGASVIEGVDVSFRYGEIHALLGPNGAGKTTIFKAILGAVRYTGRIDTEPEALRIGHLIEYPAFYSRLSLIENLQLHADYLRVSHDELDELLELVGLGESRNLAFGRTSLGMRQRLGIARTLVGNPG